MKQPEKREKGGEGERAKTHTAKRQANCLHKNEANKYTRTHVYMQMYSHLFTECGGWDAIKII